MLIHALFDDKTEVPAALNYQIYTGYFGGTDIAPNTTWFNTATLTTSGKTFDLTSLNTITNGQFGGNSVSLQVSGYFRALQTGTYTFYTTSVDASFININDINVVLNGGTHISTTRFGVYPMVAGTYYKFNIYYGISATGTASLSAGFLEPSLTEVPYRALTDDTTNITEGIYPGTYTLTSSSANISGSEKFRAFNKSMYTDTFNSAGSIYTKTIGSFTQYYADTGTATTTLIDASVYRGEWLQIELPIPITIKHFKINRRPSITSPTSLIDLFAFFGTNDPSTGWYKLYERATPSTTYWNATGLRYEVKSFDVAANINSYKYYRIAVYRTQSNSGYSIGELLLYTEIPPTTVGTFTSDCTALNVFYGGQWAPGGGNAFSTLIYRNPSLYGLYKLSLIGFYVDRLNFTTGKDDLLFISSPQLCIPGSGSRLLVLHEEPVSGDTAKKDYHLFSDDFEIVTQLNGFIELTFTRKSIGSVTFLRALLVMEATRL